jgi:hypothetical protein
LGAAVTDLFNKELKDERKARWMKTFSGQHGDSKASSDVDSGWLKSAIIINLIIQVADLSHTIQHFPVYKLWNMKLLTGLCHERGGW